MVHVSEGGIPALFVEDAEGGVGLATEGPDVGACRAVDIVGAANVVSVDKVVSGRVFVGGIHVTVVGEMD